MARTRKTTRKRTIGRPGAARGRRYETTVLEPDQVRAIIDAIDPDTSIGRRNRALVAVLWRTGLRVSEALDLKPSSVKSDGVVHLVRRKRSAQTPTALDSEALQHVRLWMTTRESYVYFNLGLVKSPYLFSTMAGGKLHHVYVRQMLRRAADHAGIDARVHPHCLRHSITDELRRKGWSLERLQAFLGHKSLASTAFYLGQVHPSELIAAIQNGGTGDQPADLAVTVQQLQMQLSELRAMVTTQQNP